MRKLVQTAYAAGSDYVPVTRNAKGHPRYPNGANAALAASTPEEARAKLMAQTPGLRRVDVVVFSLGTYLASGCWSVPRHVKLSVEGCKAYLHMDADARPASVAVEAPHGTDVDWEAIYTQIRAVSGFSVCCEPSPKSPLPTKAEREGWLREECVLVINHDE